MRITNQQFDRAFEEYQAFGPRRQRPVEERWREVLRDVDPVEFAEIKAQCKEIEQFALQLAEQLRDNQVSEDVALGELRKRYPFLNQERLGKTWSQAVYFSMK